MAKKRKVKRKVRKYADPRAIVARYVGGYNMRQVAEYFNLTLGRVQQIVSRDAPGIIRPRGVRYEK